MRVEVYRVTGRIRLGPGDVILLKDARAIEELTRLGVIEPEPMESFDVTKPKSKQQEE
jgi:hypothetical protein